MADSTLNLTDLRGGANERHPATIPDHYVEQSWNMTYFRTQLGARRNGSEFALNPIASAGAAPIGLFRHIPDSTPANEQLWVITSNGEFRYYNPALSVTVVTPSPADTFSLAGSVSAVSLHGKLYIAMNSTVNYLHVWDGTTLRRVGMTQPGAPTAADTGGGSTFTGVRRYRVRFAVLSGSTVLRRSEPSATLTFTPAGTGAAARVTKPATTSEGETHWELEESVDEGSSWYRIARTVVGTTTYDDSLAVGAVAISGTLSDDIGDHTPPPSARFLVVDRDRLVMIGNHEQASADSDVVWTPVGSDPLGVGNDERVPTDTGNRLVLDGQNGGRVTGAASYDTNIIVFKDQRVYQLSHTGNRAAAYRMEPLSTTYGAMEGSIFEGVDQAGRPALYFLDARLGPMRWGASGFEQLAPHQQSMFTGIMNYDATGIVTNGMYYPKRKEVWWHLAQLGSSVSVDYPSIRMKYNTETGATSWDYISATDSRLNAFVFFSCALWARAPLFCSSNGAGGYAICRGDVEGVTTDLTSYNYRSWIRTKAYTFSNGLIRRFRVRGGVLGARPVQDVELAVIAVRDYGKEIATAAANLSPNTSTNPSGVAERFVSIPMDTLWLSEMTVVQFEIGDREARSVAQWSLEQFSASFSTEGTNAGGAV